MTTSSDLERKALAALLELRRKAKVQAVAETECKAHDARLQAGINDAKPAKQEGFAGHAPLSKDAQRILFLKLLDKALLQEEKISHKCPSSMYGHRWDKLHGQCLYCGIGNPVMLAARKVCMFFVQRGLMGPEPALLARLVESKRELKNYVNPKRRKKAVSNKRKSGGRGKAAKQKGTVWTPWIDKEK